jgi:hypothetical protein
MSQIGTELLIGRLITDRALRLLFDIDASDAVAALQLGGARLTNDEAEALSQIDLGLVEQLARALDPRLRRVCLQLRSAERQARASMVSHPAAVPSQL